jgi:2,4-dienoyl-CoA reductase-like NADH-dependent reductase (Old Yellow Enzyme family)
VLVQKGTKGRKKMRLFEPYTIPGKLKLRNRIVMPALVTRLATEDGHVTDELIKRYTTYAKGGTGYIVTEAVSVRREKSGQLLRLSEEEFVPGLRSLTTRVHDESEAKIAPQIIHFLKISKSGYRQKVEDLSLKDIEEIPGLFAKAAERARLAGFDAVEHREGDILKCTYCNECEKLDSVFERVVCAQWKEQEVSKDEEK